MRSYCDGALAGFYRKTADLVPQLGDRASLLEPKLRQGTGQCAHQTNQKSGDGPETAGA
jgi:hypothetical protein